MPTIPRAAAPRARTPVPRALPATKVLTIVTTKRKKTSEGRAA
jgi:hypothetical protein